MRVIGYARVSTRDQNLDIQVQEIQNYCTYRKCELVRIFTDKASGKDAGRLGYMEMVDAIQSGSLAADAIVAYKLDRVGRNLRDLIEIVDNLKRFDIQFIIIKDNIDTTSPQGKLFFHLMGAFAEFERSLIKDRVDAGKERAKELGVKFGRKPKKVDMEYVRLRLAQRASKLQICRELKIGKSLLYSRLAIESAKSVPEQDKPMG